MADSLRQHRTARLTNRGQPMHRGRLPTFSSPLHWRKSSRRRASWSLRSIPDVRYLHPVRVLLSARADIATVILESNLAADVDQEMFGEGFKLAVAANDGGLLASRLLDNAA